MWACCRSNQGFPWPAIFNEDDGILRFINYLDFKSITASSHLDVGLDDNKEEVHGNNIQKSIVKELLEAYDHDKHQIKPFKPHDHTNKMVLARSRNKTSLSEAIDQATIYWEHLDKFGHLPPFDNFRSEADPDFGSKISESQLPSTLDHFLEQLRAKKKKKTLTLSEVQTFSFQQTRTNAINDPSMELFDRILRAGIEDNQELKEDKNDRYWSTAMEQDRSYELETFLLNDIKNMEKVPIGSPCLVKTDNNLWAPALIIERLENSTHPIMYNCTLWNGKTIQKISREALLLPEDRDFSAVTLVKKFQQHCTSDDKNSSTMRRVSSRSIKHYLDEFGSVLEALVVGHYSNNRRTQFMEGDHRDRVRLQNEVRPGPFCFSEYSELTDKMVKEWLPQNRHLFNTPDFLAKSHLDGSVGLDVKQQHYYLMLLARQFVFAVLLPELIIAILAKYGKDLTGANPFISYEQAEEWYMEKRSDIDVNQDDFVEYLMSKRALQQYVFDMNL